MLPLLPDSPILLLLIVIIIFLILMVHLVLASHPCRCSDTVLALTSYFCGSAVAANEVRDIVSRKEIGVMPIWS